MLDMTDKVEVKNQNMAKHPMVIYHMISTQYVDPMMHSIELCISYGKYLWDA